MVTEISQHLFLIDNLTSIGLPFGMSLISLVMTFGKKFTSLPKSETAGSQFCFNKPISVIYTTIKRDVALPIVSEYPNRNCLMYHFGDINVIVNIYTYIPLTLYPKG
jgi:hypothetical protein